MQHQQHTSRMAAKGIERDSAWPDHCPQSFSIHSSLSPVNAFLPLHFICFDFADIFRGVYFGHCSIYHTCSLLEMQQIYFAHGFFPSQPEAKRINIET